MGADGLRFHMLALSHRAARTSDHFFVRVGFHGHGIMFRILPPTLEPQASSAVGAAGPHRDHRHPEIKQSSDLAGETKNGAPLGRAVLGVPPCEHKKRKRDMEHDIDILIACPDSLSLSLSLSMYACICMYIYTRGGFSFGP